MRRSARAVLIGVVAGAVSLLAAGTVWASGTAATGGPVGPGIVGGGNADQAYPWVVSLQLNGGPFCTASLVAKDWILTAKHCTQESAPYTVRVGSNDWATGGSVAAVSSWVRNPTVDIALGHLDHAVTQTPIEIGTAVGGVGSPLRLLGWGATGANGSGSPRILKQLDTSVSGSSSCDGNPDYICVDNPGGNQGACYGDSGGPAARLVAGRWVLLGATSSGPGTCATAPSSYTDLTRQRSFISSTIGGGGGGGGTGTARAIVGQASGLCVDVRGGGTANGTPTILYTCNSQPNQQWTVGGTTIRSFGKCLDLPAGQTGDGVRVQLSDCTGGSDQNWQVRADGSIRNTLTGRCLDAVKRGTTPGTALQIWGCNPNAATRGNQQFTLA